ncbi:hypothetical protein AB0E96_11310 [Kitasatospora sp. NPDC036755]|uniref:hypothetical protein n=1 Tax=Kitasatospora sp. NPDC036755 TaxID=3154600 RepID=UPI003403E0EF
MRANHATKPQEPAPRGVAGAHRGLARWLPRPRVLAAAGALLAQLWGFGAPGACAAAADPLPDPARPAVRRTPNLTPSLDRPVLDGPALDGQSAERPVGSGPSADRPPDRSPGPTGEPAGDGPAGGIDGVAGAAGDTLQERIRAGGLPLPGQRAAVPDAFALASGLLGTVPDRARPDGPRASREGGPEEPTAAGRHTGTTLSTVPRQRAATSEPPVREAAATTADEAGPATAPGGTAGPADSAGARPGGTPEEVAVADTVAAAASGDGSATATAVLAPIAAGLLLTGAAMWKHRGLPRGH